MTDLNDAKNSRSVKFKGMNSRGAKITGFNSSLVYFILLTMSFVLPNLVFSGRNFFDTLHIMKWTVTMVPIGLIVFVLGLDLLRSKKAEDGRTPIDLFGLVWILLLFLISIQPVFVEISSVSTFVKEWFYFASLIAVYIIIQKIGMPEKVLNIILLGGCLNATINVIFAEMLIRGLNSGIPFILDVPGNYIGNTAQQEMFGLWMAMNVLNGAFLHLSIDKERKAVKYFNLLLLAVNSWGLWSSTARGGIIAMLVAFTVLVICLWRNDDKPSLKNAVKLFGIVAAFVVIVILAGSVLNTGRSDSLIDKMGDMFTSPSNIAGRASIWKTSFEVFLKKPVLGVGLGQYKWHFLDAQRIMYEKYPELFGQGSYNWQFTYWAHSEYIQWLAEAGAIGALILTVMGLWWLFSFIMVLVKKRSISKAAMWGIAMLFLLWFDAIFSRPFHRIENSVWMSLAFALANKEILLDKLDKIVSSDVVRRLLGLLMVASSVYGFYFLAGGLYGDQLIFRALSKPGSVIDKQELLKQAAGYLMSRDDAEEQFAELLISVGRQQKNDGVLKAGIEHLYRSYIKTPTSKVLFELLQLGQEVGDQQLLISLTKYLHPSMYSVRHNVSSE